MIAAAAVLALGMPSAATCPTAKSRGVDADVLAGIAEPHRVLRHELGVAVPDAPTRVTIYSEGGHLATTRISIVAVRDAAGQWRTDAVGRSRIWVKDAPPDDMPHLTRTLDTAESRAVDTILANPDFWRETAPPSRETGPPPRDYASRDVAVVTPACVRRGRAGEAGQPLLIQLDKLLTPSTRR